ncbi:GTP pyrophosphokinase [Rheinheimera soli]|uniref:PpGpp synthetase/RelA/SpoT-type nucleotidyltransferase n=1 Tax=Rheinheimera soli TaxID=443616 RepID=A0ABU1W3C4_9GAMM|nr:GTP pyrophosphokinase [Rheinheimera soli]MDR7122481.1 ppGpp synthetase/RelA/SpoT-type nucleotidyltransferase [Rheinheimera soli]
MSENDSWIDETLTKHKALTESVVTIMQNLLKNRGVDYLSVTGRTKDKASVLDKIKRKNYKDPQIQLTDLTGIRVITYLESDISVVSEVIESTFRVDIDNSLNQDERLHVNQIGYRSVHFVCDLGGIRSKLPEFLGLLGLKFEIQVRTVLQHAWAELAHDRNYKFNSTLPKDIERSLYLYAGMLEIADKGFDELSRKIDAYTEDVKRKTSTGNLNFTIDSVSLNEFVEGWAKTNKIVLHEVPIKSDLSDLVNELRQFGIKTAEDLNQIIPADYASKCKEIGYYSNLYGYVRDWMLICDWRRFKAQVEFAWGLGNREEIFAQYFNRDELELFYAEFEG